MLAAIVVLTVSVGAARPAAGGAHSRVSVSQTVAPQNPRMGLTFSNYFDGNPMYARARDAGASHDRIEFQMSALQPTQGGWNWAGYDALVAAETAHNLQVLAVLTSPSAWAADNSYPYESWPVPANLSLPWNDPNNHWAQFVYQTVLHYKASIKAWQVWNEPDIRKYWQIPEVPASLFAQLLRVSYQAIKAADPQATVVMGGFLYRHNQWPSPITVWRAIRDLPGSAQNNNYFDVMAFHLYDGGTCEHFDVIEDFRLNMTRAVDGGLLNHPIWITETGIRHWEGQAPRNPGDRFATPEEAASYVIQNYTYALHKNVGRYYYFRTTDTLGSDGSIDVNRWGLIRTDGSLRPAYKAFQVAAQYLPTTFAYSTRPNWYPGNPPLSPVSRISFYGTPQGRVSVIWNTSSTTQTYSFPMISPTATVVWQNGITATIQRTNGQYTFQLLPAPNFYWHNPPDDCLVASTPLIIIEPRNPQPVRTYFTYLPGISRQPASLCTDPVVNGGFEQDSTWALNPTPFPATYTQSNAHSGARAIQTGIPLTATDPMTLAFSSISQTFQLPTVGAPLRLTLWRSTETQDTDDTFYIRLWDQSGALHTLHESNAASSGWQQLSYDLAPFAGQRITLLIGTRNDGDGLKSVAYYDDIVLECR